MTSNNHRIQAAIDTVHRAKGAEAFYKAWTSLRSELDDTCNENMDLLHAGEAVSATPPEAGN